MRATPEPARADYPHREGRSRQAALAPYETATLVLEALDAPNPLPYEERGEILVALVLERQQTGHALWQAMLAVAFEPMIRSLRKRLGRTKDEDLDQEVFAQFFQAVRALPPSACTAYAPLALRRATARSSFAAAHAEERRVATVSLDDEAFDPRVLRCDPFATTAQEILVEASAAEAARVLTTGGGSDELRDVLVASFGDEASLKAYVSTTLAGAPEEVRAAAYERLRSARRRVLRRLAENDAQASAA